MSWISRNLKQTLTKWSAGATDVYGNPTWSSPVTVKCRWEDKQIKTLDFQGNEIISNSVVYVGEDISFGDYVYLGVSTVSSPPAAAKEVRNFSKSPSINASSFERKVIL